MKFQTGIEDDEEKEGKDEVFDLARRAKQRRIYFYNIELSLYRVRTKKRAWFCF